MIEHYLQSLSSYSSDLDRLVVLVTILVGVWFILAEAVLFWLIFRFRAKEGVPAQYITGKEKHLKRWVNIPHYLIIVCDVFIIIAAVQVWVRIKQTLPPADETVRIVARQWVWTFTHAGVDGKLDTSDDVTTTDELHVVVGKTYHFQLESLDVLHSFFVPVFRLKQDAIPGRTITGWFKPTKTGTHDILCAEICGLGHGVMGARIVIETPEQHLAWLSAHQPASLASAPAATTDSTAAAGAKN